MIQEMDWFVENLTNGIPFGYARFNDGEMMAIDRIGSIVARGDQVVNTSLSQALREALQHKQDNYYIGVPCSLCYPRYNSLAHDIVGDYELLTRAVVTTNRNWKHFMNEFPPAMTGKRLIWIGGNDQDIDAIKGLGLNVVKAARVPRRNSWDYHQKLKEHLPDYFESGDVVGISLGPAARVLVREWFEEYPDITFIDMGSNLDPITRDVWHACHKGWDETGFNLTRRCAECN